MLLEFSTSQILLTLLIFVWSGFVRSGLGFGGAALALPLMLLIYDQPIFWLPIIGLHLLIFSALTLLTRFRNVAWSYMIRTLPIIVPAAIAGVFGLISLPNRVMLIFIYSVTLFYAFTWMTGLVIKSSNKWLDRFLLGTGAYITGASLTGAPLIVAVFSRNVVAQQMRNTLLVLWFVVVSIKIATFISLDVELQLDTALMLLPVVAVGHWLGLKAHDYIIEKDKLFKQVIGATLVLISLIGLLRMY
ncbi:MAG: TSUP family transporter [Gammaproteobacteria bacterium]|nr:TSUP family transporter [Gammaproteobacteria bacterium]